MKSNLKKEPRKFQVNNTVISDFGNIVLDSDEMISFKTNSNKEYDFVAKEWGFYATPSINGRLVKEGFKTAIINNKYNKTYVMIVDRNKLDDFHRYLKNDNQSLICWLDEWFREEN